MAAQESIFAGLIPTVADITNNLPSLQFESALTDQEKPLLVLRARSHALTVCACAQAAYLVAILNEARFSNVLKPEFSWKDDGQARWEVSKDVCSALEDSRVAGLTCPLTPQPDECLIRTGEKWVELAVYIFLNMCSDMKLSWEQSLDLANTVILGQTSTHPAAAVFSTENFTKNIANPAALFPRFDLSLVTENDTPLTRCFKENHAIRNLFSKKYVSIFDKFYYWKGIKQVKQKKQ
ncbi:oxidoreductase [Branchiostoma belcheri]|nr:oxidoreductase [Branchiostoma belcheri]